MFDEVSSLMKEYSNRQYDLDWIKVIATLAVFVYHCLMFVNPFPWHVKNSELNSGGVLVASLLIGSWLMPIFFAVSGMSVFYAWQKRRGSSYLRERLARLGIPLVFGVFILSPPQVFIERITRGQFNGSFFEFVPHYFDGLYLDIGGPGNFAFVGLHLWYVLVLLAFSFLTLPLFSKVSGGRNFQRFHFVLLPLSLICIGIIQTINLGGWDVLFYLLVFIYGYYFFSSPSFKPAIRSTIKLHGTTAVISSAVFITWFMIDYPKPGTFSSMIFYAVHVLNGWSWLMCIFYLGDKYLSFSHRYLNYGSEASMPFYVLHQPIIVMIGFLIRDLPWTVPMKLSFLLIVSFLIIAVVYHFIIRRFFVLRLLFGMKGKKKERQMPETESRSVNIHS